MVSNKKSPKNQETKKKIPFSLYVDRKDYGLGVNTNKISSTILVSLVPTHVYIET